MPASGQADVNVISPENSVHSLNLGVNAFFNGTIIDVTDYTTITVTAAGNVAPAAADALQIEWYDSDNVFVSLTVVGSGGLTFQTLHSPIRTSRMRVRYHAAGTGQSNLHVETLLRKGAVAGSVMPIGSITGTPDAQVVDAVTMGRTAAGTFVSVGATSDTLPILMVDMPPRRFTTTSTTVTASLSSVSMDPGNIGGPTRRNLEVYNNTVRGNLFLRYQLTASLVNYDIKIPPQHTFQLPWAWPVWGGTGVTAQLLGIWDVADGEARVSELR